MTLHYPRNTRRGEKSKNRTVAAIVLISIIALGATIYYGFGSDKSEETPPISPPATPQLAATSPSEEPTAEEAPDELEAAEEEGEEQEEEAFYIQDGETIPSSEAWAIDERENIVFGVISGGLYASISPKFGKDKEARLWADRAAAHFKRIFMFDIDFKKDPRRGDRFAFAYKRTAETSDNMFIVAAFYESQRLEKTFEAVYYKPKDAKWGNYYYSNGSETQLRLKNSPIKEYEIVTSLLNDRRPRHSGIDFKAPTGTPLYLSWPAVVVRKNWNTRINGVCVDVQFKGTNARAFFLHLDSVSPQAEPGRELPAGHIIGKVGNTGRSFAPHLHYQIEKPLGRVIDPLKYHGTIRNKASGEDAAKIAALWKKYEARLKGVQAAAEAKPSSVVQ